MTYLGEVTQNSVSAQSESDAQQIVSKFLGDTKPEDVFKISFDAIPLFWTIPVFYLNQKWEREFTPTLVVKSHDEFHILIDTKYILGLPEKALQKYLSDKNLSTEVFESKYQSGVLRVNELYNEVVKLASHSEDNLRMLLQKNLDIFQDFFATTSLAYLDHSAIFGLVESDSRFDSNKIKTILEVDVHKSFELIHEEIVLDFIASKRKDYQSLVYLFTSYSKVPSIAEVENMLKGLECSSLQDSLKSKKEYIALNTQQYKTLYSSLNIDEKRLVDFIQAIKTIREDRKQYLSKLFFCLYKISELLLSNWKIEDVKNGNIFAFELLKGKNYIRKNKDKIINREQGFVFYCDGISKPSLQPFSGDTSNVLKGLKEVISNTDIETFKGQPAYKGKVSGNVVVAIKAKDFSKIKDGMILVTSMTRPEILPYLKHVTAIVTDEGGITCHAAIISREMQKPCIIGTKIATQTLQDGDLVEVNANTGVVKIIEKAK